MSRTLLAVNRLLHWTGLALIPARSNVDRPILQAAADAFLRDDETGYPAWWLRGVIDALPELDVDVPSTAGAWWAVIGRRALADAWWRSPGGALLDALETRAARAHRRLLVNASSGHLVTDPSCRFHVEPRGSLGRWGARHGRGLSCPRCHPLERVRAYAATQVGKPYRFDPPS